MPTKTLAPDDPRHGTANGYRDGGCRCDDCRGAWRERMREYRRQNPRDPLREADRKYQKKHGINRREVRQKRYDEIVSHVGPGVFARVAPAEYEEFLRVLWEEIVEYGSIDAELKIGRRGRAD